MEKVQIDINATNNASPIVNQVASDIGGLETSTQGAAEATTKMTGGVISMNAALDIAIKVLEIGKEAYAELVGVTVEYANNVRTIRDVSGQTAEEASRLVQMLDDFKISTDDATKASKKLTKEGLELNVQTLGELSDQYLELNSGQARAAFLMDNFGKSGEKFAEIMLQGSDAIYKANDAISDNLILTDEALQATRDYETNVDNLSDAYTGLEITVGNNVIPVINDFLLIIQANLRALSDLPQALREAKEEAINFADSNDKVAIYFRYFTDAAAEIVNETAPAFMKANYDTVLAIAAHGEALDGIIPKVTTLADAEAAASEVDAAAVKGAMQVHDTYDKLDGKMIDLKLDHDELLAKKQELISLGWWPESEKIQDVNDKLADNEKKQKDVTLAMQGTLAQMLLNTAAAGLDAEGQLALARATGQIDEATYAALSAQGLLKKEYEDGKISAEEYAKKTLELKGAVDNLKSKDIAITVDAIFNELHNVTTSYMNLKSGGEPVLNSNGKKGYAAGTNGWESVPSGYPNDTYPILLSSGERFAVIPEGTSSMPTSTGGMGGGIFINFTYAPEFSLGSEAEMRDKIAPVMMDLLREAQNNGVIPS